MKIQRSNKGFSALDLVIVIATVVVIAGVVLPMMTRPKIASKRIRCVSNLKIVNIGFRLWAIDREPPAYPTYHETNQAWNYYQIVGHEIGSPNVLLCPEDPVRKKPALDFEQSANSFSDPAFQNNALSYFYGVDSSEEKPEMILSGDRTLSTNATMVSGLLSVKTNSQVQWTKGMHKQVGNLGLADGSVQQLSDTRLLALVRAGTNGTQRLMLP